MLQYKQELFSWFQRYLQAFSRRNFYYVRKIRHISVEEEFFSPVTLTTLERGVHQTRFFLKKGVHSSIFSLVAVRPSVRNSEGVDHCDVYEEHLASSYVATFSASFGSCPQG
ncbi:hypothetical protein CEXT_145651 [Caerostris extrusa]|uniref:Maturase K n=1 Tax=Caerostris extrusa TaxID=172846 RepID=A0AAV4W8N2_CAEEX|nr:hypothetical protein CEXT_145651 [Caerostris extrusa]